MGLELLCGLGLVLSPLWPLLLSTGQVRELDVVTSKGLSSFTIQERGPKPSDLIILNHHRFVVVIFSVFRNI